MACQYLFVEPRGVLDFCRPGHVIGAVAYLATCSVIIGFGDVMRRAQASPREQREVLRITLASIGDAVITTDLRGRVTYMNAVAGEAHRLEPGRSDRRAARARCSA